MSRIGFEENIDFVVSLKNEQNLKPLGGRPSKDYFLSIETAKEISMLQRTEKGKCWLYSLPQKWGKPQTISHCRIKKKASKSYHPRSLNQKYNHKHI